MSGACQQRLLTYLALGLPMLTGPALADDLRRSVEACAQIVDDGDRLACFDALVSDDGESIAASGSDATVVAPVTAADTAADPAPSDTVEKPTEQSAPVIAPARTLDEEKEREAFDVRLTRCTQTSASGRQVYYLDNGEVWRQSNNSRNNVRDCDTPVTIYKDLFGYKMEVPSENRSIRISPVR